MERQKDELVKMSNQKDKSAMFRKFMKNHQDVMFRFFVTWKEYCRYYKHTFDRFKLRLINLNKQNMSKALFKWKEGSDKKVLKKMMVMQEDLQNENQNMQNTLGK